MTRPTPRTQRPTPTQPSTPPSATTRPASQSALSAAAARAAHLRIDHEPWIFADTLAATLLGDEAPTLLAYHDLHGNHLVLAGARAQVLLRSHVTESVLAAARTRGVSQYVVLGAGLDSYAYRIAAPGCTVFEVDHAMSQQDKRDRVAHAGLTPQTKVVYVPMDFESDRIVPALEAAGFALDRPAVVSWLGVSMYLTGGAVAETFAQVATMAAGTELVFDYMLPGHQRDDAGQAYVELVSPHNEERGEPWQSFFTPAEVARLLHAAGFRWSEQLSQAEAVPADRWNRTDALRPAKLSMIAHARI